MSELPPSPLSYLDQVAVSYHEMFLAYVRAGFTVEFAEKVILTTISANVLARYCNG